MKNIKIPTKEQIETSQRKYYEKRKCDVNNLSYWFSRIKDCGIRVPETIILPITFEQFKWFVSDNYIDEDINKMGQILQNFIMKSKLKGKKKLFMKTGTFSNKFDFTTCKVESYDKLGQQILSIYYAAMIVGDGASTEIVIRDFIESDQTKTIYHGMPLNTEFRIFYDFDNKQVLGCFNYWDREVMLKALPRMRNMKDCETFSAAIPGIEENFNVYKGRVIKLISDKMPNVDLKGRWSIDLMLANGEFYLIDMATAETSYYYDKIAK